MRNAEKHKPRTKDNNIEEDENPKILYSEIYSIDGILLQTILTKDYIDKFEYPQGIYIKKDTYIDNTIKTSKFIK